ncbi:hypothetical protein ACP70R_030529 [Stipagrostis hirtigluma subsp. patula]
MEKVSYRTRVAVVALVVVGLLLAAAPAPADAKGGPKSISSAFSDLIKKRDKEAGALRVNAAPGQANPYTRGCNPINQCRG